MRRPAIDRDGRMKGRTQRLRGAPVAMALVLAGALAGMPAAAPAQDRADIDRTQIIGNRELPKVLYIVPWRKPVPGELSPRPLDSVLDEALAPLDRDVFRRQIRYDGLIRSQASAAAPAAANSNESPAAAGRH